MENPYHRGKQILGVLAEYGPLTVRGVEAILEPKMHRKQVRLALKRLHDRGYTRKRYDGIFRGAAIYHEITQNPHGFRIKPHREYLPISSDNGPP
jgi:hypothetical protein